MQDSMQCFQQPCKDNVSLQVRKWGSERWSNLPETTQLEFWLQSLTYMDPKWKVSFTPLLPRGINCPPSLSSLNLSLEPWEPRPSSCSWSSTELLSLSHLPKFPFIFHPWLRENQTCNPHQWCRPLPLLAAPYEAPCPVRSAPREFRVIDNMAFPEKLGCFLTFYNPSSTTEHISFFDMATRKFSHICRSKAAISLTLLVCSFLHWFWLVLMSTSNYTLYWFQFPVINNDWCTQ